jgi:hypothetical protein
MIEALKLNRQPITSNCRQVGEDGKPKTCSRSTDGESCDVYAYPALKWRVFDCPMADEFLRSKSEEEIKKEKVRVGQQKQKKKARKK